MRSIILSTILAFVISLASVSTPANAGVRFDVQVPVGPVVIYDDVDLVDSDAWVEPEPGVIIDFGDCWHCYWNGGFWIDTHGHRYFPHHERREGFDRHEHEWRHHGERHEHREYRDHDRH